MERNNKNIPEKPYYKPPKISRLDETVSSSGQQLDICAPMGSGATNLCDQGAGGFESAPGTV